MASLSLTEQERAVIKLVTRACRGMNLETTRVDVHKLEGGTMPTLRFTLEGTASTDIECGRIASGEETAEFLANSVVLELNRQLRT